ncbi:tape measure protein [Enterobacter hormaechei]|uniref:tape measure protein n=1 Tax=Enterobacter hormaechei TaxID=158836 RepID=UPI0023FA3B74|nr:tape measure protein [Enterobacter hormaechei]MDF7702145.1 tape measure protein [Enterobacter hormaechei subsp. steigerwaltii]
MASEEQVGNIVYQVQMDVANLIEAQRKVNERLEKMNSGVSKAASKFDELKTSISRVAGAIAASIVVEWGKAFLVAADNMSQLNARIERLTGSASVASQTMQSLMNISSTTGGSLQDTAKLWETLSTALRSTGATNGQILQLTDTLQKIGRIGGTSAEEMANALRQFGQSISSGVVRAEEFNSILEQMPELARQMAAGLGIGIGELRQLMLDGKLSAQDALNAIQKQTSIVNAEFAKLPRTLSQANAALTNSFLSMVDSINQTTGASRTMVAVIDSITTAIDRLTGKTASAAAQISDLNSTAEMFERRARTWSWLGLDGWEAQSKALAGLSNKAAALVGDISAVTQASQEASNTKPINIKTTGDDAATSKLIKNSERRLALAKLEGEARARLQAQYDAADAGITDQKRIKALQDEYAETYRVTEARKESNKEGKTSASQAESIAQKLANLRAQSDLTTESIEKRRIQEAGLRAEQSLGSAATQQQLAEARALGEANEKAAISIQKRKEAEQGQKYAKQEIAAGNTSVNPITGASVDPLAQINLQETQKLEAIAKYQELDKQNTQLYEDAKTAIQLQASNARMQIAQTEADQQRASVLSILGSASQGFDSLASIIADSAGKSNAAYQVMFAASKAFAFAQSTLSLNTAIMQAMADPTALTPEQKLANYAAIASAGASLLSNVASISYGGGRENGGPVSASSMYRVGEGGKPEIFKASNGSQYMIPGDNGRVISNRDMGGGGGAFNYSPVIQVNGDPTEQTLAMLEAAVKRGAQQGYAMAVSDVASGKGKLSNALTNNFNTSQRLT